MPKRIAILQGHPDPEPKRYLRALASAYREGAEAAGHAVRTIEISALKFPLLRTKQEWEQEPASADVAAAMGDLAWAEHWAIFFPLWLGDLPALAKGFLEQGLRPGLAFESGPKMKPLLAGRSARLVVTMGMPAFVYRWWFGAPALKNLRCGILGMAGIKPVRETVIGSVESMDDAARKRWLEDLRGLGREAC